MRKSKAGVLGPAAMAHGTTEAGSQIDACIGTTEASVVQEFLQSSCESASAMPSCTLKLGTNQHGPSEASRWEEVSAAAPVK